jgi:methoxymalonate biosynthesis acyl carrier protein
MKSVIPTENQLSCRLNQFFLEKLNVELSSPYIDLIDTGLLDSLNFIELLVYIEQIFGLTVSIEELDLDHFRSIANISSWLSNQLRMRLGRDGNPPT